MRLEELELAVKELKVRLGEDNLGNIFFTGTRASTDIAGLSHVVTGIVGLHLGGVGVRLGGHDEIKRTDR